MTVPEKCPCTLSERSKSARLTMSSGLLSRVTMARRRSCCPFPACVMSSRAAMRPMRPKPYSTTSRGCSFILSSPMKPANFFAMNSSSSANSPFSRATRRRAPDVEARGRELGAVDGLRHAERVVDGERVPHDLAGVVVEVEQLGGRAVDHLVSEDDQLHRPVKPQLSGDVDEFEGRFFVLNPAFQLRFVDLF